MIKFFRHIRQRMLKENKTSKYLIYALGEIILVVIGILIALQINNWNEGQKDLGREHVVLIQLRDEYQTNLSQLEEKMGQRSSIIEASLRLLSAIDQNSALHEDSLAQLFINLYQAPTFDPIQNDLISSGSIRLIQNKELKLYLSNWSADVVAVREIEVDWGKEVYSTVGPFARKTGLARNALNSFWDNPALLNYLLEPESDSINTKLGKSNKTIDMQAIMDNVELEGILATAYTYNRSCNAQSIGLKQRIEKILELLNNEIAKKN